MASFNQQFGEANPFADFFEDSELGQRAAFFSNPATRGNLNRQNFFANQFRNVQNQFLGQLGEQLRSGNPQPTKFLPFSEGLNLERVFRGAAPAQRGVFNRNFAPPTRSLFF